MKNRKLKKAGGRLIILGAFFAAALVFYAAALTRSELTEGKEYLGGGGSVSEYDIIVDAARGDILDRNYRTLISGRQGNTIRFNAALFPSSSKQSLRNRVIASLVELLESRDEEWEDNLPMAYNDRGVLEFLPDRDGDIAEMKSVNYLNLNSYATPENCLSALRRMYDLKDYDDVTARKIASVLYEMWRTGYSMAAPFTFAEDVSNETVSIIKENSEFYSGVDAIVERYREIRDGSVAPHILGLTGVISAEEYKADRDRINEIKESPNYTDTQKEELSRNSFTMTDTVGKFGIESAMEEYLRGKKGVERLTVDGDGVVRSEYTVMPTQGSTVVLTIDSELQAVADRALKNRIYELGAGTAELPAAGAVAVVDVNTGEVLASSTYPTYNLEDYYDDFDRLLNTPGAPLVNRVIYSVYEPGSTFKPAMALAGLETGVIDAKSTFYCTSVFQYFDVKFTCLSAHGTENVVGALRDSCNTFFYNVGDLLGIDRMNEYCSSLGLGQKTGVELPESKGILAGKAYRESIGAAWRAGDTIQAAIGQSDNLFTILQLANYCATIANGGTRYRCHYVKSVMSPDMKETIMEVEPEVLEKTGFSAKNIDIVKRGMLEVTTNGTTAPAFSIVEEKVGAKTGTTQVMRYINGNYVKGNNGLNISFGPYDSPEIAIAVIVENVDSGTATADVAADIYKYYFSTQKQISRTPSANEVVR